MPDGQLYERDVIDARPMIEVGNGLIEGVSDMMISFELREQLGGLSTVEFVLSNIRDFESAGRNFAFEFTETNHFAPGTPIRVLTGDQATPREMFRGLIGAVSFECADGARPRLRVMAEDALMGWRMVRRNRTYEAGPLRDILEAVVADTALTAVITGLNDEVDEQQQVNETDLGFLRRLLCRYDADAQVVGEELHISPRAAVDRGEVTLALGEALKSVRVVADLSDQRTETQLHGFSLGEGQTEEIASSEGELGPGEGVTGIELVGEAYPDATDMMLGLSFQNATEAQTMADVAQTARARRFVVAEGSTTGNANLRVGTHVVLEDLGPRFSNTYTCIRACHRYDERAGYITEFTAECAFLGRV